MTNVYSVYACLVNNIYHFISLLSYLMSEEKIGHIHSFFDLEAEDIDKNVIKFDQFKGGITVITNVASYCGKFYCSCYGINDIFVHLYIEIRCLRGRMLKFHSLYTNLFSNFFLFGVRSNYLFQL